MIKSEGSVERQVQDRDSQSGDGLRIRMLSAAPDAIANSETGKSCQNAKYDAAALADPLVIDGVFENKCHAEHQRHGADAADPGEADLCFEFARAIGFCRPRLYW